MVQVPCRFTQCFLASAARKPLRTSATWSHAPWNKEASSQDAICAAPPAHRHPPAVLPQASHFSPSASHRPPRPGSDSGGTASRTRRSKVARPCWRKQSAQASARSRVKAAPQRHRYPPAVVCGKTTVFLSLQLLAWRDALAPAKGVVFTWRRQGKEDATANKTATAARVHSALRSCASHSAAPACGPGGVLAEEWTCGAGCKHVSASWMSKWRPHGYGLSNRPKPPMTFFVAWWGCGSTASASACCDHWWTRW